MLLLSFPTFPQSSEAKRVPREEGRGHLKGVGTLRVPFWIAGGGIFSAKGVG